MSGFIAGKYRHHATLFPERLDDYIAEDSAVAVIDVFVDDLDLCVLRFKTEPGETDRPAYHPLRPCRSCVYKVIASVCRRLGAWSAKPTRHLPWASAQALTALNIPQH